MNSNFKVLYAFYCNGNGNGKGKILHCSKFTFYFENKFMINQTLFKLIHAKKSTHLEYKPKQLTKNIYDAFMDFLRNRKLDLTNPSLVLEKHHVFL